MIIAQKIINWTGWVCSFVLEVRKNSMDRFLWFLLALSCLRRKATLLQQSYAPLAYLCLAKTAPETPSFCMFLPAYDSCVFEEPKFFDKLCVVFHMFCMHRLSFVCKSSICCRAVLRGRSGGFQLLAETPTLQRGLEKQVAWIKLVKSHVFSQRFQVVNWDSFPYSPIVAKSPNSKK